MLNTVVSTSIGVKEIGLTRPIRQLLGHGRHKMEANFGSWGLWRGPGRRHAELGRTSFNWGTGANVEMTNVAAPG